MTTAPRVDPIPAEARAILRKIAEDLRRTPRPMLANPAEVARIIARTADRIEGVAALSRPGPSPRAWRVDGIATRSQPYSTVTVADGREVRVEIRRQPKL